MENAFTNTEDSDSIENGSNDDTQRRGLSGWYYLTRNQSVNKMVDALLDLPPNREFNKTELAELADVSRNSVGNHIKKLHKLHIIERVPNTSPDRFRLNTDSDITQTLIRLDGYIGEELNREEID